MTIAHHGTADGRRELTTAMDGPQINRKLYSDIIDGGGLAKVSRDLLARTDSGVTVSGVPNSRFPFYARIARKGRFSQINVHPSKRLFHFDIWEDRLICGTGEATSLTTLIAPVEQWVAAKNSDREPALFEDIQYTVTPGHVNQLAAVAKQWDYYLSTPPPGLDQLDTFINLAAQQPLIRGLYPYSSLASFCLSRCTRYPYSRDCPTVAGVPHRTGRYAVYSPDGETIGVGDAEFAVSLVIRNIPVGSGPAVRGTVRALGKYVS